MSCTFATSDEIIAARHANNFLDKTFKSAGNAAEIAAENCSAEQNLKKNVTGLPAGKLLSTNSSRKCVLHCVHTNKSILFKIFYVLKI